MDLKSRIVKYRAMHLLTQRQMDDLLGEKKMTTYRIESGLFKTRLTAEIRISQKLDELERKESNV